jgi:hypothetical protein
MENSKDHIITNPATAPALFRKELPPEECVSALCNTLADLYLDYRNDYLTVEKFAEHKGLPVDCVTMLLNACATAQEYRAAMYKELNA